MTKLSDPHARYVAGLEPLSESSVDADAAKVAKGMNLYRSGEHSSISLDASALDVIAQHYMKGGKVDRDKVLPVIEKAYDIAHFGPYDDEAAEYYVYGGTGAYGHSSKNSPLDQAMADHLGSKASAPHASKFSKHQTEAADADKDLLASTILMLTKGYRSDGMKGLTNVALEVASGKRKGVIAEALRAVASGSEGVKLKPSEKRALLDLAADLDESDHVYANLAEDAGFMAKQLEREIRLLDLKLADFETWHDKRDTKGTKAELARLQEKYKKMTGKHLMLPNHAAFDQAAYMGKYGINSTDIEFNGTEGFGEAKGSDPAALEYRIRLMDLKADQLWSLGMRSEAKAIDKKVSDLLKQYTDATGKTLKLPGDFESDKKYAAYLAKHHIGPHALDFVDDDGTIHEDVQTEEHDKCPVGSHWNEKSNKCEKLPGHLRVKAVHAARATTGAFKSKDKKAHVAAYEKHDRLSGDYEDAGFSDLASHHHSMAQKHYQHARGKSESKPVVDSNLREYFHRFSGIEEGKALPVGTKRSWKNGEMVKTSKGWEAVLAKGPAKAADVFDAANKILFKDKHSMDDLKALGALYATLPSKELAAGIKANKQAIQQHLQNGNKRMHDQAKAQQVALGMAADRQKKQLKYVAKTAATSSSRDVEPYRPEDPNASDSYGDGHRVARMTPHGLMISGTPVRDPDEIASHPTLDTDPERGELKVDKPKYRLWYKDGLVTLQNSRRQVGQMGFDYVDVGKYRKESAQTEGYGGTDEICANCGHQQCSHGGAVPAKSKMSACYEPECQKSHKCKEFKGTGKGRHGYPVHTYGTLEDREAELLQKFTQIVEGRTFEQARSEILSKLKEMDWDVKTTLHGKPLKIPYATSPSGKTRYWFKSQAIYSTSAELQGHTHEFKSARSIHLDIDTRNADPAAVAKHLASQAK